MVLTSLAAQARGDDDAKSTPSVTVAEPIVPSTETSQSTSQGASRRSPEIPAATNSNKTAATGNHDHDQTVIGGVKTDPRSSGTSANNEKSTDITEKMDVDNTQHEATENTTNTEMPAQVMQNVEIVETQTQSPNSKDPQSSNMEIEDMQTHPANAADPQSSTHSTHEIPVPLWLSKFLHYLQSVSDSEDWQTLVLGLIEFEKLDPPRGVGFWSPNTLLFTKFITCRLL